MRLSIVVPVFKEERNVPEFVCRVLPVLRALTEDYEVIFALDPSPDRTEEAVLQAHSRDPRVKLVKYSRRVGQPMATLGGLAHSSGDAVIVMDVDLQDPPELVGQMVATWREGYDVVYAQRRHRNGETWVKRAVSFCGYKFINRIAEVSIPPNTGDFRLMSRRVVDEVLRLKENHGFLRGLVALVGFRQTSVPFDRPVRFAGAGHYNRFLGSLRIGLNGVFCFSNRMLTLTVWMGLGTAGFAFLLAIVYFILKAKGVPFPMGNPTIVILVLFMGGVQLISVGILGAYVGRIYDEVKDRPKFIVDRLCGFDQMR
jgi:polyisoprenyl-phosphate glycosyltransferase